MGQQPPRFNPSPGPLGMRTFRAQQLAEFELYWGEATLLRSELGHYLTVSADDIRRAVASTLTKARRSRIEVRPRTEGAAQ